MLADFKGFLEFEKTLKQVAASSHCLYVFERSVELEEGSATVNLLLTEKVKEAVDPNLADVVDVGRFKDILDHSQAKAYQVAE